MLAEHGLKPFGTYFDMFGNGGSTISGGEAYTFIDSSYPQILIRYGFVTYIVANILWIYTTWKAIKTGNRRVAYVMTILAVDFVMEHHWYELSYNAFVLIPFADFSSWKEENVPVLGGFIKEFKDNWKVKKYALTFTIMSLCQLLTAFLFLPTAFSWLRTIFNGYGLYGGGWNGVVVFSIITLILMVTLIFIWSLSGLIAYWVLDKKIRKNNIIPFSVAFIIGATLLLLSNALIKHVINEKKDIIESERGVLELIVSEASGKLYADKLPEIYKRNIKGISRSYLCGEDFARYENATVIADASLDSQCLTGRGFLYLPISEEDALFTNDEKVISSLQREGYKLRGYNTYEYQVNLKSLAVMNGLDILNDGSIQLDGTEHQLIYGPYLELYSGKYAAWFKMKLTEPDFEPDDKICTLRISSYYGKSVRAIVDLYRSDFDEEGYIDYKLSFTGPGQSFEFLAFTEEGVELEIDSISYRRTPDNDAHNRIDSKGRVTRTEFYDIDGNPLEKSDGYYGIEYAYDNDDNVIMWKFLGKDFKPVTIITGYAEMRREYNVKREVVKESYYGEEGEPVELSEGYHSVEKEYDFSRNLISELYYDNEGKPVLVDGAYFKYIRLFNKKNQWVRTEYYDTEGDLILQNGDYAIIERSYDDAGNVIVESYYGLQNEPVLYNGRYHKSVKTYNEKKQCIKELYYGIDGELFLQDDGYAGYKIEYDDAGNLIKYTHIGLDEKPVKIESGYSIWRRTYNSRNQAIREEYFDVDEKPVLIGNRYAMVDFSYDEDGRLIKKTFKDMSGNVVGEQMIE